MTKRISHIGIAVKSIEETAEFYEKIGLKIDAIEVVESQKVRVAFIPIGEVRLELLEPTSESSTVAKFIEKRGEGVHHIALSTDDLETRLSDLDDQVPRRYSVAGNVVWLGWPDTVDESVLDALLRDLGWPAVAYSGKIGHPLLGRRPRDEFSRRLLSVMDPQGKFSVPEP